MSSPIVAFVSIFLGLTIGVHPVEVLVSGDVDHVELWLDYELVGRVSAPGWKLPTDFGAELEPHLLEAVAFDAGGEELGRVEQWVNLPTPAADAHVVIEREADGTAVARLTWESVMGDEPERVALSLDGVAVEVADPSRVRLPAHDPAQLHFLRAELAFPHNVSVVEELTFGGSYGDRVDTELTALPILLAAEGDGSRLPGLTELQSWFLSGEGEAVVAAVDEGPAEIIFIRDRAAQDSLHRLGAGGVRGGRFDAALKGDQKLAFFWPFMVQAPSGLRLFPPPLGWMSPRDGGVAWFMANMPPPAPPDGRQLLADAVAVAGMNSLARNRRRAVVLILGREPSDESQLSPPTVRHFLSTLRVPLHVWSTHQEVMTEWGVVRDVSNMGRFRAAVSDLARQVERQRIVWLQGRHLPQRVRLSDRAAAIAFPG